MAATPNPPPMPDWAQALSEKYYSRTLSVFVLYGNVRDLAPLDRGGATEYVPLLQFLNQALFGRRDLVLTYDRGGGLSFARQEMQADFRMPNEGFANSGILTGRLGISRNFSASIQADR